MREGGLSLSLARSINGKIHLWEEKYINIYAAPICLLSSFNRTRSVLQSQESQAKPPSAQAPTGLQYSPASQHPIPSETTSPQRSKIASLKMSYYHHSPSDASVNIHRLHSANQKAHGSGTSTLLAARGFWVCHDCQNINNKQLCPERCGVCPHFKCGSCSDC